MSLLGIFPVLALLTFSELIFEILSNLDGYIDNQLELIRSCTSCTVRSLMLKKEALEVLRVRAYRHKNCFGYFLESICLQEGFIVKSNICTDGLVNLLSTKQFSAFKVADHDVLFFVSEGIAKDSRLAERFCQANVNTSRVLTSEVMIVLNSIPESNRIIMESKIKVELISSQQLLAQYALRSKSGILSLIAKSPTERKAMTHLLSQIPGLFIDPEFDYVTMTKQSRNANYYRNQGLQALIMICRKILAHNVTLGFDPRNEINSQLSAELTHVIYVGAIFIFEILLEIPFPFPEAQSLFTDYISPCVDWIPLCLENIIKRKESASAWFNATYSLEILNSMWSLGCYTKPIFTDERLAKFVHWILKFEKTDFSEALANKKAFVIDQTWSLLSKIKAARVPETVHRPRSVKVPDQDILEIHGYIAISTFCTNGSMLYKCLDQHSRKLVAIKRLTKPSSSSGFDHELSTLMTLQHTNIVRYLEYFENQSYWFMVMEYCGDTVMRCSLDPDSPCTEQEVRAIGRQILNGLYYLHTNHIVHRDIKPNNILKDGRGFIKIADFGEAQLIPVPNSTENSRLIRFHGTPAYMAPECVHSSNVNQSADIWSMACVLAYLLSGQHPWQECNNNLNILYLLGTTARPPFETATLNCSEDMKRILGRMIQRDPTARPTVIELIEEPLFSSIPDSII